MTAPANDSSLHRNMEASQKLHKSFTDALQKLFLKATIHRTVFLFF
jgi:hypothetical protein